MNDLERWINLQGPQPPGIRALFDAARDPPEMTPEQSDELDRLVFAAIAADRRREARKRAALKVGVGLGLLAAGVAGALLLGSALQPPPAASIVAKHGAPDAELPRVLGPAPSVSATARVPRDR